ncbi:MAG: DUF2760 domain-containing protein [Deltaproteobacteria bacterium]|nr:MAG: DUF2760 domain-containing protein [Deltaproteobacteria bacterium]
MSRLFLALLCFFRILFGKQLPPAAVKFLPETTTPPASPPDRPQVPVDKASEARPEPVPGARPEPGSKVSATQQHRDGALAMLALLQREGRLVDFLREPLDGFTDADIGAAAPVMPGSEEARVSVPKGFDPAEIRLIGEAKGEPPFRGTLRHHGWRVVDARLPALSEGVDRTVIAPAEVEL